MKLFKIEKLADNEEMDYKDIIDKIKTDSVVQQAIKDAFFDLSTSYSFNSTLYRWVLNHLTKEELKDVNPRKAISILSMLRSDLFQFIKEQFEDYDIAIDYDVFNEIAPTIEDFLKNDSEIMNYLKKYIQEEANEYLKEGKGIKVSPYTLSKKDDKVGDVTEIDDKFSVDLGYRDAPFVFLNGNIEIGRESDTHSMLLTRLINNEESSPDYLRGEKAFEMTGDNELAFGHIVNGLAFLEVVDNVNVDEVVNKLINLPDIDKVYDYQENTDKITRLAKLF